MAGLGPLKLESSDFAKGNGEFLESLNSVTASRKLLKRNALLADEKVMVPFNGRNSILDFGFRIIRDQALTFQF